MRRNLISANPAKLIFANNEGHKLNFLSKQTRSKKEKKKSFEEKENNKIDDG